MRGFRVRRGRFESESPNGSEVKNGRTAREVVDGKAVVVGGNSGVAVEIIIAGGAEEKIVSGTADGDGVGSAVVTDLRAEVLEG